MNVDTWAVVLATFLGPISALLITRWRDGEAAKYNRRLHVFRILMATRKIAISSDHVNALNLIEVDYYGSEKVQAAWKSYLDHLNATLSEETDAWRETKERRLAELLFQMSLVLKFDMPSLDLFKGGYAPSGWGFKESRQNEMLEYFHHLSTGEKIVPIWIRGVTPQDPKQAEQSAQQSQ